MNRGTRRGAAQARWVRFLPFGVLALAVVAGGSLYLARGTHPGRSATRQTTVAASTPTPAPGCGTDGCAASPAGVALAATPVVVTARPGSAAARTRQEMAAPAPSRTASPASTAAPSGAASSSTAPGMRPTSGPVPAPSLTMSASAAPTAAAAPDGTAAAQVLALINSARASAGLPALTIASGLETSSSQHDLLMAGGCGLSHQCPGEAAIGDRETAAGVSWTACGENVGEGGPAAATDSAVAQLAAGLTQSMLDEKPPDDGHRLNILSTAYTHIGIAVYRDSAGMVWLTQDFSS
jgi:uncharacterized protein YkwD